MDEIKLNLVMSCETQFMNPSMTKTLSDLKTKLSEKETQIVQLRKRLRTEEHRSHNATTARDQVRKLPIVLTLNDVTQLLTVFDPLSLIYAHPWYFYT